jgi:hypothetical protein
VKEAISLQLQGGGQASVGDVGEGNPRAIWRSLMRIRSAIGDDDRVTTTFAQCERALSTAGTAQQQPPSDRWWDRSRRAGRNQSRTVGRSIAQRVIARSSSRSRQQQQSWRRRSIARGSADAAAAVDVQERLTRHAWLD